MEIFIYKLIDPRNSQVRYIGKTKKPLKKRLYEHLTKRNLIPNNHKNNWIKKLLKEGTKPIIELIESVSQDEWIKKERFWIDYYKSQGSNLTNSTVGGEGAVGFKMPPKSIQKRIETKRKNGTLKRSQECRARISKANLGRKYPKEATEKTAQQTRKIVYQKDSHGNIIRKWFGVRKCCLKLNLCRSSLWNAIKNNSKYRGYYWSH